MWQQAGKPCSKKLKIILRDWLGSYQQSYGELEPRIVSLLLKISPATIDRILNEAKIRTAPKGVSLTKPGTLL